MASRGRVVLAMSGGVDSSVAAHLLKRDGYDVVGLFMRTGTEAADEARRSKTCCSVADSLDARRVADKLDIPFFALDFSDDFNRIRQDFVDEYVNGRTPNPCVRCNVWLKFGKLWDYGRQIGADFVATGHYARVATDHLGRPRLARAVDRTKDQTYVLSALATDVLGHLLLPVGEYPKDRIREMARELELPVHDKADSQEICFVPDDDYVGFVRRARPDLDTQGEIVDEHGQPLGHHDGFEAFTIGQRRGLGIAVGEPRYVVQIEPKARRVVVGPRQSLEKAALVADRFRWQVEPPTAAFPCLAQIRAQHRPVEAVATPGAGETVHVRFQTPQTAVTPGQVVALYEGDFLLGGGWIDRALDRSEPETTPVLG